MMNGQAFYDLSTRLSAIAHAAERRSATSRAYYGAYHKAAELLRAFGITLPYSGDCHQKVTWILDKSGDQDVVKASKKLSSLRNARNNADYDLSDPTPEKPTIVATNVASAAQIMACIDQCFPGNAKANIRDPVRVYAKETLKLIVS